LKELGNSRGVGDWTAETRHKFYAELLNMLHGAMVLYEKRAGKEVHGQTEV
jgi:hypothetical protein